MMDLNVTDTVPHVLGCFGGAQSDAGRTVVFVTQRATAQGVRFDLLNPVPTRVMLRDLQTGSLQTLGTDSGIVAQAEVISLRAAISPDATRLGFVASFADLASRNGNNRPEVFVQELDSGSTTLVSTATEGLASSAGQFEGVNVRSDKAMRFSISGVQQSGPARPVFEGSDHREHHAHAGEPRR